MGLGKPAVGMSDSSKQWRAFTSPLRCPVLVVGRPEVLDGDPTNAGVVMELGPPGGCMLSGLRPPVTVKTEPRPQARRAPGRRAPEPRRPVDRGGSGAPDRRAASAQPSGLPRGRGGGRRPASPDRAGPYRAPPPSRRLPRGGLAPGPCGARGEGSRDGGCSPADGIAGQDRVKRTKASGSGVAGEDVVMREASATHVAAAGAMKPSTVWMSSRCASRDRCQIPSWWAMRLRNLCSR